MWAMFAAPLLAGNDISNMTADTKEILMNKEVIAIDRTRSGNRDAESRKRRSGDMVQAVAGRRTSGGIAESRICSDKNVCRVD